MSTSRSLFIDLTSHGSTKTSGVRAVSGKRRIYLHRVYTYKLILRYVKSVLSYDTFFYIKPLNNFHINQIFFHQIEAEKILKCIQIWAVAPREVHN